MAETANTKNKTVEVTVKRETGVTFQRKEYAKGDKLECTEAQKKILEAQGVI